MINKEKIKANFRRKHETYDTIKYYQEKIKVENEKLRKLDRELLELLNN